MIQLTLFTEDIRQPARQGRSDIRIGDAAEAFVIAKLLKAGFDAHGARRDAPYDVGVDLGKGRYCRIQVKGRERARHGKWDFRFVRGNPRTGAGTYAYTATDFELSDYKACASMSLDDVALALGLPGKIGGHGSEVKAMVRRGEIDNVRAYCEGDCLNLFVLYVRWAFPER